MCASVLAFVIITVNLLDDSSYDSLAWHTQELAERQYQGIPPILTIATLQMVFRSGSHWIHRQRNHHPPTLWV